MKKILLFLFTYAALQVQAQPQLQNPSFEQWNGTINPTYWSTLASFYGSQAGYLAVEDDTTFTNGSASIRLYYDYTQSSGRINGRVDNSSDPSGQSTGQPFTRVPDSLVFDYRFYGAAGFDAGVVDYYVSKNGVYGYGGSVGGDIFVNAPQSTWATMSMPFNYSGQNYTPDSIFVSFISTSSTNNRGAKLWVDNVRLIYNSRPAPAITTDPASNVLTTSAQLNATAQPNGGSNDSVYFEWGTSSSYGHIIYSSPVTISGSTVAHPSVLISGLSSSTTYYYRAVIKHPGDSPYNGAMQQFTTASGNAQPVVTTDAATNVQATSAQLNATISPNGTVDVISFDWGTSSAFGNNVSASPGTISGSNVTGASATLGSLSTNMTYYYRAVVTSGGQTYYGAQQQFTTGTSAVEQIEPATVKIYPNPAHHSFVIEKKDNEPYVSELVNMMGQKVAGNIITDAKSSFDVSSFPNGIYLLNLKKDNGVFTYRIVVMNN